MLDLIDRKHTGIIALLDEQCIVPRSTDEKFTRYLYAKCDSHPRFTATSAQRVDYKFSVEHYAGPVEYGTESWLEKNKDQLPASSANLLKASEFKLLNDIQVRHCVCCCLFVTCTEICAFFFDDVISPYRHAPSFHNYPSRSSGPRTARDAAPSRPSLSAPSSPSSYRSSAPGSTRLSRTTSAASSLTMSSSPTRSTPGESSTSSGAGVSSRLSASAARGIPPATLTSCSGTGTTSWARPRT